MPTWMRGAEVQRRPLPSLVIITRVPVSATREVGPADAQVGLEEFFPQGFPGGGGQGVDVLHWGDAQLFREEAGHFFLALVQGGGHQVEGGFSGKLDDVFAQVGLVNVHADGFEDVVQVELLGDHGFALGGDFHAAGLGQVGHDGVGLGGVGGEMDAAAVGGDPLFQEVEVVVQVVQGVGLYPPCLFPPLVPDLGGDFFHALPAGAVEAGAGPLQGYPKLRVADGDGGGLGEIAGLDFRHGSISFLRFDGI